MHLEPTSQFSQSPSAPIAPVSNRDRAFLLVLVLLQIGIFFTFAFKSFWLDEILSLNFTDGSLLDLFHSLSRDLHPPGYFLLLWAWQHAMPISEYSTRLLSLILSLPTIPLLYALVRRVWSREAALWSCAFLAFSPFHAEFAAQARMYSGLEMLTVLSTLFLVIADQEPRNKRATWGYAAAIVACIYFQYFGFFVLAAHVLWFLLRGKIRNWRQWLPVYGAVFLFLIPCFILIPRQLAAGTSKWIQDVPNAGAAWSFMPNLLVEYTFGEWRPIAGLLPKLSLLFSVFLLISAAVSLTKRRSGGLLALMFLVPLLIVSAISLFKPILISRYLIETLPFFFALLGIAISTIRLRPARWLCGIAMLFLLSAGMLIANRDLPRNDWLNAVQMIQQSVPSERLGQFAIYTHDALDRECVQFYMLRGDPKFARVPVIVRPYGDYRLINPAAMPPLLCVVTQKPFTGAGLPPVYKPVQTRAFQGVSISVFVR